MCDANERKAKGEAMNENANNTRKAMPVAPEMYYYARPEDEEDIWARGYHAA